MADRQFGLFFSWDGDDVNEKVDEEDHDVD